MRPCRPHTNGVSVARRRSRRIRFANFFGRSFNAWRNRPRRGAPSRSAFGARPKDAIGSRASSFNGPTKSPASSSRSLQESMETSRQVCMPSANWCVRSIPRRGWRGTIGSTSIRFAIPPGTKTADANHAPGKILIANSGAVRWSLKCKCSSARSCGENLQRAALLLAVVEIIRHYRRLIAFAADL